MCGNAALAGSKTATHRPGRGSNSMTTSGPQSSICPNCGRTFEHRPGPGRPRTYCGTPCRRKAQRLRNGNPEPEPAARSPLGRPVAENLQLLAARLVKAEYDGEPLAERLQLADQISKELGYYTLATVDDARAGGTDWATIAQAAHISPTTARKHWHHSEVQRRLAQRSTLIQAASPSMPRQRTTEAEETGSQDRGDAPPGGSPPSQQLADALSHLHRACGRTIRDIAQVIAVSPSYVSRVLSGDRLPTWQVTRRLVSACGGDPAEVRTLWKAARGLDVRPSPQQEFRDSAFTLKAAIRGLHLSADHPDPAQLKAISRGMLNVENIKDMLEGDLVPDWPVLEQMVTALHGRPGEIRPLWEAAANSFALSSLHPCLHSPQFPAAPRPWQPYTSPSSPILD